MIEVSNLVTFKVESRSQTPSLRLRAPASMWLVDCACARTMLTTFTISCIIRTMQLLSLGYQKGLVPQTNWGCGQIFIMILCIIIKFL